MPISLNSRIALQILELNIVRVHSLKGRINSVLLNSRITGRRKRAAAQTLVFSVLHLVSIIFLSESFVICFGSDGHVAIEMTGLSHCDHDDSLSSEAQHSGNSFASGCLDVEFSEAGIINDVYSSPITEYFTVSLQPIPVPAPVSLASDRQALRALQFATFAENYTLELRPTLILQL